MLANAGLKNNTSANLFYSIFLCGILMDTRFLMQALEENEAAEPQNRATWQREPMARTSSRGNHPSGGGNVVISVFALFCRLFLGDSPSESSFMLHVWELVLNFETEPMGAKFWCSV